MSDEIKHEHPSFGMVALNRTSSSGGRYLFGSPITDHFHTIRLSISTGYALEGLMGEQRFRASRQIVEVELSAAQFAELITTMNVGDGVPCTILRLQNVGVEEPPRPQSQTERAHVGFEERMRDFGKTLRVLVREVHDATDPTTTKGLTQRARDRIRRSVEQVVTETETNIPYFLRMFQEAAEKVSSVAKAEADAWLTHAVRAAGLEHLRKLGRGQEPLDQAPPELPEHEDTP